MKTLYVRINPRKEAERFYRCGIAFGQAWQVVCDLDDATAQRLEEEQMLETTETRPVDLTDDVPAGDSAEAIVSDAELSASPVSAPEAAPVEAAPVEVEPEAAPVEVEPEAAPVEVEPEAAPVETAPAEAEPEAAPVETAPAKAKPASKKKAK